MKRVQMRVTIQFDTSIDDATAIHTQCGVYRDIIKQQIMLKASSVELTDVQHWPRREQREEQRKDVLVMRAVPMSVRK